MKLSGGYNGFSDYLLHFLMFLNYFTFWNKKTKEQKSENRLHKKIAGKKMTSDLLTVITETRT